MKKRYKIRHGSLLWHLQQVPDMVWWILVWLPVIAIFCKGIVEHYGGTLCF